MYVIHHRWYVINPKEETYKAYALITYSSQGELITYAYRRLHTNPSDWIKKERSFHFVLFLGPTLNMEPVLKPDFLYNFLFIILFYKPFSFSCFLNFTNHKKQSFFFFRIGNYIVRQSATSTNPTTH